MIRIAQPLSALCLTACACLLIGGCSRSSNSSEAAKDAFGGQRKGVSLSVFNDDFAQVDEKRPFDLKSGVNSLRLANVSKQLDPSSVLFAWSKPDLQVVSNTYDLGVGDSGALLQRYVGSEVEMVWYGDNGKPGERQTGRLEIANGGEVVLRTGDKLIVNPGGTVIAPAKSGVVAIPQLSLGVESKSGTDAELGLTYLTRGLSWSADYVATLDPNADAIRLECWASVTNKTGVDFPDAKITLVAGSPNRAARSRPMGGAGGYAGEAGVAMADPKVPAMQMRVLNASDMPFTMGEMHAYPIKAKSTIAQEQINRVRMMYGPKVKVKKDYSVRLYPSGSYYNDYNYYGTSGAQSRPQHAQLAITFYNTEEDGLGLPLPMGAVRMYEPDAEGANHYVGAAQIYNTPEKGRVNLTVSNVFDVSAEPKLLKTQRIDKRRVRQTYEVKLANRKKAPVELRVVQSFYGTWKIETESLKSGKLDAHTNQWKVPLPARSEVVLKFAVVVG